MKQIVVGILLFIALAIPPVRLGMESIMIIHMLVQIPLLIFSGWLIGIYFLKRHSTFFNEWNHNGIPGILFVVFITMFWMIPRTLDEALLLANMELFKFISLPIVGIVLRHSWRRLKTIGKSFIFLNYLSMFGLMAWLYIDSPIRICNNYLEIQQQALGWGFLGITGIMVLYMLRVAFVD